MLSKSVVFFIIQKEMITVDEKYFETFNSSPEEVEKHELEKEIESLCVPRYAKKMVKIAQEIVDSPPENLQSLLEVSSKMADISNKVQDFSAFLNKLE